MGNAKDAAAAIRGYAAAFAEAKVLHEKASGGLDTMAMMQGAMAMHEAGTGLNGALELLLEHISNLEGRLRGDEQHVIQAPTQNFTSWPGAFDPQQPLERPEPEYARAAHLV